MARAQKFGLLVDWLEDEELRVAGVMEVAREAGVDLVCFVGAELHAPVRFGEQRNVVYDLARAADIDGLVILAATMDRYLGPDDLVRYCERFLPLPISSTSAELRGMTSILIDNASGLRDGMRHLLDDHGYRRIAFICGPEGNLEADVRLGTYREVLTSRGLTPPDTFLAPGDFNYESGVDGVRLLLDERSLTFDAIVTANDRMAFGVIDALRARDIRVPRDVAILGFDDIGEARYSAPPLTTIRQPLLQQGRLALEVLLQRLRGEHVEDVLSLPAELVIRRSCGCDPDARRVSTTSQAPAGSTPPSTELTIDEALACHRSRILAAMREPMSGLLTGISHGWDEGLLDALIAELQGSPGTFVGQVNLLLADGMPGGGTGTDWQPVMSALRREVIPCLDTDPLMRSKAEDVIREARDLVGDVVEHTQAQHRLAIERRTRALSEAAEKLSAAFDLASLGRALRECLPRLGIPSAYLILRDEASPALSRVAFAYDERRPSDELAGLSDVMHEGAFVPAGLLPDGHRYAMVVEPLFFKDDALGHAIFELGPLDGSTYEALREQISGALKVGRLIEEAQLHADQLEEAYEALQDNQQALLSSEKMAALGRITANIAHEMNSPLAAVRAALAEIDLRAVEYAASVGDKDVTDEDHLQIAAEMRGAIGLARSAAERAAGFVRGIKTQTRDLAPQERVRFDPVPVIEESLLLLSYDIRRATGGVRFQPPRRPIELLGTPGRLAQIVTNLVINALDALPEGGAGAVTLTLTADGHEARLQVQDNGSGIAPDLLDKIFEPMFTTKPLGQGTGLGLSIVKDLVDGHFGGHIDVASEPGHGTTFTLTFPLAGKD